MVVESSSKNTCFSFIAPLLFEGVKTGMGDEDFRVPRCPFRVCGRDAALPSMPSQLTCSCCFVSLSA